MKCPRDGTRLARVDVMGLELDKCHKCDGIWFDRGEMERLRDSQVTDLEEVLEKKYGDPDYEKGSVEGYMLCPRCGDARLRRQGYTYVNPVQIDRCGRCHGVWIDDGELNAIIGEKKGLEDAKSVGKLEKFLAGVGRIFGRKDPESG